ncbi:MAG: UDP-N-acetylglucosamine 2-epimerase (non-hydrolyzing), partial [Candidatus Thermoplasmatota archaeon]|nr:UDP-N-acetylglucosamine 2-epimerase (non-hydrolyzing) [Candidatus Thermoplasmatota archaeon]
MKIAIVVGTRPEIIKMSPVIRECEKQTGVSKGFEYYILHTGQHYSYHMDKVFFEQLNLPDPRYNLDVGSASQVVQTARILAGIEEVLLKDRPDVVLVQGDTNSVLAGALAASKLQVKVGHVEAGLRSYDRSMPEEINRVVTDHISDYCFAPTTNAQQILLSEGIPAEKIFVTGNTIVDAVYEHVRLAKEKSNILSNLGLQDDQFFLVTSHRQENVDNKERFTNILSSFTQLCKEYDMPVVYPVHPRAKKMIQEFNIPFDGITLIDPVDFLDFLQLEKHARLVLTDSGGVQEETCILSRPCVTLRDNTERPET